MTKFTKLMRKFSSEIANYILFRKKNFDKLMKLRQFFFDSLFLKLIIF